MHQTSDGVERIEEKVRLKLRLQGLQSGGGELTSPDFTAAIKMERVCGADDPPQRRLGQPRDGLAGGAARRT